jgi:hypothetical protein
MCHVDPKHGGRVTKGLLTSKKEEITNSWSHGSLIEMTSMRMIIFNRQNWKYMVVRMVKLMWGSLR